MHQLQAHKHGHERKLRRAAKRISALQYSSALARVFVSVVSGASAEDIGSSSNGHGLSDGGCG